MEPQYFYKTRLTPPDYMEKSQKESSKHNYKPSGVTNEESLNINVNIIQEDHQKLSEELSGSNGLGRERLSRENRRKRAKSK